VAEGVRKSSLAVLEGPTSEGERYLHSVLNHFDRIHTNRPFQRMMQQEMMRLQSGERNALVPMNNLSPLVEMVFRPIMERTLQVLNEGIASGELIPTDPAQIQYAATGANVFYFVSAPFMKIIQGSDPMERSALEFRRNAAIEYLGQALFVDRRHGAEVAARVLAESPMPADGGSAQRATSHLETRWKAISKLNKR